MIVQRPAYRGQHWATGVLSFEGSERRENGNQYQWVKDSYNTPEGGISLIAWSVEELRDIENNISNISDGTIFNKRYKSTVSINSFYG